MSGRGLGRSLAGVSGRLAVSYLLSLQRIAVAVDPSDGVLVDGRIKLRGIGRVLGHRNDLGSPSVVEGVGVLRVSRLGRSLAVVYGNLAVSYLFGLKRSIPILPSDSVLAHALSELRGVSRVAGHRSSLGIPAAEGIICRRGRILCRGLAGVSGSLAVGYLFGLDYVFAVLPSDSILVDGRSVSRLIGRVTGYRSNKRSPSCKGIGVLHVSFLGRIFAVARDRAVGNILLL